MRTILVCVGLAVQGLAWAADPAPSAPPPSSAVVPERVDCVTDALPDFAQHRRARVHVRLVDVVPGARTLDGFVRLTPAVNSDLRVDGHRLTVVLDGTRLMSAADNMAPRTVMPTGRGITSPMR